MEHNVTVSTDSAEVKSSQFVAPFIGIGKFMTRLLQLEKIVVLKLNFSQVLQEALMQKVERS